MRTGWSASAPVAERRDGAPSASLSSRGDVALSSPSAVDPATGAVDATSMASLIETLDRRLRALEIASRDAGAVRRASASDDGDVLRRVRELLAQSESKQQGVLALRIAQVIRDVDAQRVEDLKRIQQGLRAVEATVTLEAAGHRELTNYILTSARQK